MQRGRSSSRNLNRVAVKAIPWLLSFHLQPTMLWVASEENPSDDPTRGVPVRAAKTRTLACRAALEAIPQQYPVPWHCTRLAWRDEQLAFNATKGYPGEGPQQGSKELDLTLSVLPATRNRYATRIAHFGQWLSEHRQVDKQVAWNELPNNKD
eukprot:3030233-Amphidinium_carterae.1